MPPRYLATRPNLFTLLSLLNKLGPAAPGITKLPIALLTEPMLVPVQGSSKPNAPNGSNLC